jgi:hypothetical protein
MADVLVDFDGLSAEAWADWFSDVGRADVALLLFVLWDPIGVRDEPAAANEYIAYAPACLEAIRTQDPRGLAERLTEITRTEMRLDPESTARLEAKAQAIIDGARASAWRWAVRRATL